MKPAQLLRWAALVWLVVLLAACSPQSGSQSGAAAAILEYIQALVQRDAAQLASLSCADWEAAAQLELESFAAVTITLEQANCQEAGTDGQFTLVNCSGKIVANYGNEQLELVLSERSYQAVQQGGDWLMCGYR